jgi:phosphoglycolate phosphatase-like HAD superfamily hydrolase
MTRRTVIFDFDGTLADTMPDLVDALAAALPEHLQSGGRPARELVLELLQLPPRQMIQRVTDLTGWSPAEIQAVQMRVGADLPTRLFPEVPGVLVALKEAGYGLVMSSAGSESTLRDKLEKAGIADQCDFTLGTDFEKGINKDDLPRVAAERMGMSPEEFASIAVFVADLPTDMQLAQRAGLLAIGRLGSANAEVLTAAGAQHVIRDLTELQPLLERLHPPVAAETVGSSK